MSEAGEITPVSSTNNIVRYPLSEARRSRLAGGLIMLMLLGTIAAGLAELPTWPAGLFAWGAGILLIVRVGRSLLLQICFLSFLGISALFGAIKLGGGVPWPRLFDTNVGIIAMLASVSFLRIISLDDPPQGIQLKKGARAFAQTLLSVALFGGFINISAPILIADRISRAKGLNLFAAQSITRVFPGGASWSPFFAGMAVVLTYVPEVHFLSVMMVGLPFAAIGFLLVISEAHIRYREQLDLFEGYPMTLSNLWVPLALTVLVVLGHTVCPDAPILVIISLSAITATFFFSFLRQGVERTLDRLRSHISKDLAGMAGEILLFLAAGILAVGLSSLISAINPRLPMTGSFDAVMAGFLLGGIIVTSALGIHPVISIAVTAPLLAPIQPDPLLLSVTYVFGWSLGTCASPLSGMNLIIQGRYGIPSGKIAVHNWSFAAVMSLVGLVCLQIVSFMRGV